MTKTEAYAALLDILRVASEEQHRDVADILRLGAGCMPLPDGAVLTAPGALPPERRESYCNLCEGITWLSTAGAEYVPVYVGAWEPVLATLVLEANWPCIAETAAELRAADALQAEA